MSEHLSFAQLVDYWAGEMRRWELRRQPMAEHVLAWLRAHCPQAPKVTVVHGDYRIAESTLLTLGFIGGSVAGYAAQRYFKHKTYKRGFQSRFRFIVQVQLATLVVSLAVLVVPH